MSQPVDVAYVAVQYDTSQSLRQLRTEVGRALDEVVRAFDRAFSTIERESSSAGADLGHEFQQGGERAEDALEEVERQARSSMNTVQREARQAGTALGGLQGVIGKLGLAAAGAAVVAGLGMMASSGLQAAASLEQTQVAFNALLGSAEKGKEVFDGLKEFAAATPFELTDLTGVAQRFLAFNDTVGITDDQLQNFLTTLGDVASVTGAGAFGMERVTLALGQIASTGKLTLDNLNQISEALPGFSGIAAVAAAQGITTAEALEKISAGEISAKDGVNALIEGMQKFPGAAGAMEAQSQTLLGVFSTFKDTISQALAGAFEPVIPALKSTIGDLTPILGNAISTIAPAVGNILTDLIVTATPLLEPLANILGIVLDAIRPFIPIVGQILTPIIKALVPVFEALAPVLIELAPPIQELIFALLPLVPVIADILVAVIAVANPLIKLVAVIVSFLSQKAIVPLVTVLAEVLGFLAEAVRQFGVWLTTVDWGAVLSAIGQFFVDLWDDISGFFTDLWGWLSSLPRRAAEAFVAFNKAVLDKVREFIAFMNDLPRRIREAIGNFATLLLEKGKDLIRGLWNGISAMGGWLWNKITGFVATYITNPIKEALGISSPSTVMRDEVGRWIPAGIEEGVTQGVPQLRTLIESLVMPPTLPQGAGAGMGTGGGVTLAAGAVVIQISGPMTVEQATAVGEAAGNGVVRAISRRNIGSAVRQA